MKKEKVKLIKQLKKTRPDVAEELKDMPLKDFKVLVFVFNQWKKIWSNFGI